MSNSAAALLDVDGTLVDTNYQHALAWFRAFRQHEVVVPIWRVHRHIGMGGDQLVAALAGDAVERDQGDAIRDAEKAHYGAMIDEVEPMRGARELVKELKARGWPVVLASSAKAEELEHYVDLLDVRGVVDGWTSSADVERTKPHPDLVQTGFECVGADSGVLVGDSTWDVEAASRAGVATIALLTGGFSRGELSDAGACAVFESLPELIDSIADTPLAGPQNT